MFKILKALENQYEVPKHILKVMHRIRIAGNIAAHDVENAPETEKCEDIQAFLDVLSYFNENTP